MSYLVKEIFYTLQGEGGQIGRPSVFCRFSGCNLWTGREQHRSIAICQFCDTDFVGTDGTGGGKFRTAEELAAAVDAMWGGSREGTVRPYVVCTGGEPLLQLDQELVDEFHEHGFEVAVETNGTQLAPMGLDWICVSPKAGTELVLTSGNDLKLVFPQEGVDPADFIDLPFDHFRLQPMDGPSVKEHTAAAIAYCLANPIWRLSLQTHKFVGIR